MKILYIQHTSVLGGSSKSLLELIQNLPSDTDSHVLCPRGQYSDLLKKRGIKVFNILGIPQFDNTRYGHYRKFRWLILLREFFYLPFLFFKILSLRKEKYDLIHINDITQIYSLIFVKLFLSKNIVVHCRAMYLEKENFRTKILRNILNKFVKVIIPIDKSVSNTLININNKHIIHNGLSLENINIENKNRDTFTVGIVANFQRYKGIIEYLDAANICINEKKLEIKFNIYGASYQNSKSLKDKLFQLLGFREDLNQIVKEKIYSNRLEKEIILKGFVYTTNEIYNNIDLHVFPSHLNAAGRPVFEAAFYKIPSIVAIENPFDDAIIDGQTGVCIKEKDSMALANAIEKLYKDRKLLEKMGKESHKLAHKYYNSKNNALKIYELYKLMLKDKNV